MRGALTLAISILMLVPTAVAPPPQQAQGGLSNACQNAASNQPCLLAGVIPETTIGPGESQTYEDGEWTVDGTITVQAGGALTLDNAIFQFTDQSGGIHVETGGLLSIVGSVLEPHGNADAPFALEIDAGSSFTLNTTTIYRGNGVKLRTSDANVSGNSFEEIGLALFLHDVEVTIHHNQFLANNVSVNQTGGANTLAHNRFDGGQVCVRNWLTDPTIESNVFRGCHVGILHQRSASVFRANDMEDQAEPPGVGILVEDTNSPLIEGNRIANYGTGVLVVNATAYIRNNEIVGNVGDGVRVESNTQPMDIQNNTIAMNGGDGVELIDATDVLVHNNTIHNNSAYGVATFASAGIAIQHSTIFANGVDGIGIVSTPQVAVHNNTIHDNAATGLVIGVSSPGATVRDNLVADNGQHGIFVRSDGASIRVNTANNNGLSGFAFEGIASGLVDGAIANGNDLHGLRFLDATLNATDVLALSNGGHGVLIEGSGNRALVQVNASANGGDGFRIGGDGFTALSQPRALFNGGAGLNQTSGDAVAASLAWWEGNAGAGVHNQEQDALLQTECAYWGSADGPTTPDNPGGTGDEVIGPVDWSPYRTSPGATACSPPLDAFTE